ncbi:cyclic nucleotide-binding domain-containing protein 2 [Neodiprion pinetum]|uniref:cyclic nucleotide-binding domain-containing protein 2 n=1 Tax=Neodiprion pinetum TaxID=441929 RepID=UPI001EDE4D73|nr:cyclic nucleotide-binding domain-containing protein 2-like [Neodiprion pinetum]
MSRARSNSLRDIFVKPAVTKKKKSEKRKPIPKKLQGRYRFRAVTRLVLEYMEWIQEVPVFEEFVGDDITKNVKMAQRKRVPERKKLTIKDRSVLLTNIPGRSKENRAYLAVLMRNLQPYKKYPESMWDQIAGVTGYQYFGSERVLVRQGHMPQMLYYIVRGEVKVSKIAEDNVTGDRIERVMETLGPGDMFGEVAILHAIPRSATVVTKTSVDLLTITREDFNVVLRPWLTEQWEIFKDAIVNFNYFKGWDEETMRECCILSKIRDYRPDEVLLGDAKGMVNYVHFILHGKCRVIEHMVIHEELVVNKVKYKLYDPQDFKNSESSHEAEPTFQDQVNEVETTERISNSTLQQAKLSNSKGLQSVPSEIDYTQLMLSRRPMNVDMERTSIFTLTLQDVVNEWHEITDVTEMLMKEPSATSQKIYPKNVRTVFMQICLFYRGACFGLGEKMCNRRIVSISPTRCLLIPRYWLLEHNRANIWEQVRLFMDSKYPTTEQLFKKFVKNRRWMTYKKGLLHHIIENGRKIPNSTTIHDVPYSIRITDEIETIEKSE